MDAQKPLAKDGSRRGGARPGAGGPKKAVNKLRDDFDFKFQEVGASDFDAFYNALKTLALGVTVEKQIDDENTIVYTMPPDRGSLTYYFDRMAGRPRQAVTIDASKIDMGTAVGMTQAAAASYVDPTDDAEQEAEQP